MKRVGIIIIALALLLQFPLISSADEKEKSSKKRSTIQIPKYAVNISKENTYPNATQDLPELQPSELARDMLSTTNVKIENPQLIKLLNESTISPSKISLGYRAKIYLGKWALNYDSEETNVNWEYKKVNVNELNNRGGNAMGQLRYVQEQQKKIEGGLTARIPDGEDVKKMMIIEASNKTELPLSFKTVIGRGTKKENVYNVPPKKVGYLYSYIPAVSEKGRVTYGEVYISLKGSKRSLEVKNVTHQGIGAWIPVQDYLTFKFNTTN